MGITVVSLSGPSGSGKTSLVQAIAQRLPNAISLHFDDYKETTQFPEDLTSWIRNGCDPNEWLTPKMVEDLQILRNKQKAVNGWVIVEEPFGRNRDSITSFIDYVVCIDIPLEIAFARTVKRAAIAAPINVEVNKLLENIVEFVDQYLTVGRDTYAIVNKNVMQNSDLIVDGIKAIDVLADEIVNRLIKQLE
ncbi:hypothetical protein [Paenibacillus eucommiae]|uniref:Uridine kinase n=1 Tax=Paenibacillus eucommiae TaxID=1355755 RepID=A0ABS4JCR5_9BACL|nr:hypothetical protein [Paenibacillus eucommiae]MBP1996524.1 uridine kinase [Paenibacillus eucommiae]